MNIDECWEYFGYSGLNNFQTKIHDKVYCLTLSPFIGGVHGFSQRVKYPDDLQGFIFVPLDSSDMYIQDSLEQDCHWVPYK